MVTDFTLVRHGETSYNKEKIVQGWSQVPLNETGIQQAKATAAVLKDESFDEIWYSDLKRTAMTMEEIRKYHPSVPAFPYPGIREWHLGFLEEMPHSRVRVEFPEYTSMFCTESINLEVPGGERRTEFQIRVNQAFDDLAKRSPGKKLLVVTHAGVLTRFYYRQTGKTYDEVPEVPNASYSRVRYHHDSGTWEILEWGTPCPMPSLAGDSHSPAL